MKVDEEEFHSNPLTLHNAPLNTGVLIIQPGTQEDGNSRGQVWFNPIKGYELIRKMF